MQPIYQFFLSLALFLLTGITLLEHWNDERQWKRIFSLIGFITFTIFLLINIYVLVRKGHKKSNKLN